MPSFNGGGDGNVIGKAWKTVTAPARLVRNIFICVAIVVVIIIIILIVKVATKSGFDQDSLDKPMYDRHKALDYTCPLSNPVPPSSDKQSQDIVNMSLHRSSKNMAKMHREKSLTSVNKAAKANFGLNVYDELTTYE
jgi:hypothetical protein